MKKRTTTTTKVIRATAFLAGALAIGGCQSDNGTAETKPAPKSFFPAENGRPPQNVVMAHVKKGARSDGMLQSYHFDGNRLNALGEAKLDLMMSDDPDAMTTVYLNFPENEMLNERRDDVVAYFRESGVEESRLSFVSGPNPATFTPAASGLARIDRTENAVMQNGEEVGNPATGNFGQGMSSGGGGAPNQ